MKKIYLVIMDKLWRINHLGKNLQNLLCLSYLLLTYYCVLVVFIFPIDTKDKMDQYHPVVMRTLPYLLILTFRETYQLINIYF